MKVLQFIETGGPGGAERVVLGLAKGLLMREVDTHVLTLRTGWLTDQLKAEKINHSLLPSERRLDITLPLRLSAFMQENGFSVLHSHLLDSNFYGAMAAALAGIPHVATEHGDVHHTQGKKLLHAKLRIISWCGSSMTAVSKFSADHVAALGFPASRLSVVGNPLPLTTDEHPSREAIRAELGIGPDEWVWAHVANLRPVKDQRTLVEGFAYATARTPVPQRLVLVGDGPERPALEARVRELGIEGAVLFSGFRDDVDRFLAASDGFVLSSLSESLPMSILEAARHGLVLVTSAVGGLPEIVRPGETGFLFSAGSPEGLADELVKVCEDRAAARTLADRAKADILGRFSLETVLDRYTALYATPR